MNDQQFDLDEFNPDGMYESEISDWKDHFAQAESQAQHPDRKAELQSLWKYCEVKEYAMIARKAGDINLALFHEKTCDSIYDSLPASLKW